MSDRQEVVRQDVSSLPDTASETEHASRDHPATRRRRLLSALALLAAAAWLGWYLYTTAPRRQIPPIDLQGVHPDVAEAIQAATAAVRHQPRSAQSWGYLGMLLHAHEYYAEARTCYQLASRLDPQEFRWPYFLANLQETDDRQAALAAYQRSVEIQPKYAQLHIRLAELLMDMGRPKDAERELESALQLAPENGQAQFRKAQLLFQRRAYQDSLEWAHRAADHRPPRRETHELLLQLYHRLGQTDEAAEESRLLRTSAFAGGYWPDPHFEELKRLRRDPLWMAYQAHLLLDRGQAPAAIAILEGLVQQQPDDAVAREHLARAFIQVHLVDRAGEVLDEGLSRLPRSAELRRLRGAVHLLNRQWPQAVQQYQAALAIKPDDAASHLDLGYGLAQVDRIEEALAEFRQALRFQPDFIEPRLEIARLLLKQGETQPAQKELNTVLQLSPQNNAALELLKSVEQPSSEVKE